MPISTPIGDFSLRTLAVLMLSIVGVALAQIAGNLTISGNVAMNGGTVAPVLEAVPALGWDQWRVYQTTGNETNIKANVDAMASNGMKAVGYKDISVDSNWATGRTGGVLQVSASLFPSGMTSLGNYIHAAGFTYMIYGAPGTIGCNGFPGSQGFETGDAAQYASFGADGLFYDNCSSFASNAAAQAAYQTMGDALRATGRTMRFRVSAVYPDTTTFFNSPAWGATVGGTEVATAPDIQGFAFDEFMTQLDLQFGLEGYVQPGRHNWMDMLGVGNGSS